MSAGSIVGETVALSAITPPGKKSALYPSLYQVNTRATLLELGQALGRRATLDDIPDRTLDEWVEQGFDWIWLLGVWQTGPAGRRVSRSKPEWQKEFKETLPDLEEKDVAGSCFAVANYEVNADFGGAPALDSIRGRLHERGLKLLLDFVPNHTALDHPWVQTHPEFYIRGTEEQLQREPENYVRLQTNNGPTVFAYGRDPYFSGWPDTLQLNYAEPSLQAAMKQELLRVSEQCDGVRCDMAMLILPDVFERTWRRRPASFWPDVIKSVRSRKPDFLFMAEVYWDLEWTLQQQGFNYTYDKRLYDRLLDGKARPVREHFHAEMDYQQKSVRFLENHDEQRAATAFSPEMHRAAAILTYLCPGLRFFHDGQLEGRTRKLSMHLGRRPTESVDISLKEFYGHLLACLRRPEVRNGNWRLLECEPAWDGNWTWDCFICFGWSDRAGNRLVVVANYAPHQSQCYLHLRLDDLSVGRIKFVDLMGPAIYEREGEAIRSHGLYLDIPGWGYHVFKVEY